MERGTVVAFPWTCCVTVIHERFLTTSLMNCEKLTSFLFVRRALLNYLPQEEGGQPNYQPESSVLTVEFTNTLLKNRDPTCARTFRAPATK